jgi:hypothetical protein
MKIHARFFTLLVLLAASAPATAPAAPGQDAPAFEFGDLRIQKTDVVGDKNHARFKSGENFYVAWYVRILQPPKQDEEMAFTYSVTPENGAQRRFRSTAKIPAGYHDGIFHAGGASFKLTHGRAKVLKVKAQVMMNGVVRTRTKTITIVP